MLLTPDNRSGLSKRRNGTSEWILSEETAQLANTMKSNKKIEQALLMLYERYLASGYIVQQDIQEVIDEFEHES